MGGAFMKKIGNFLSKDIYLPLIAGLASGLYPWAFYFTNNFDFVNSWDHFFFFLTRFVIFPIVVYYIVFFLMQKKHITLFKKHVLPTLNAAVFFTLLMIAIYAAVRWKHILLILFLTVIVFLATFYVKKILQKIVVLQLLMVITTLFALTGIVKEHYSYSDLWMQQPDDIDKAVFKNTPNIYVIQTDGYVNFSELKKGYYNFDNYVFENWLLERDFVFYENYRSNYKNTITSNTSMFTMKHHHYNTYNERNVLMNENAAVKIFNANKYKTHAFLEVPYFLINRPQITFDYTNYNPDELPYFTRGLSNERDIIDDFKSTLNNKAQNNFYFFEKLQPWHVTVQKGKSKGKEQERKDYLERLKKLTFG